jgi:hypothetical protein
MTQRFYRQRVALLAALAVLTVHIQGCGGETQSAVLPAGTRQLVWVDLSSSVSEPQRQAWLHQAETIIKGLIGGDTIAVFGVHEATPGAAPLYLGHLPAVSPEAPLREKIRAQEMQHKVREQARAMFGQALSGWAKAQRTDLFGALDRLKPDEKSRPTVLYFFSDMLHVTAELNMEKTPLAPHMQTLVDKVIAKHGWPSSLLNGTTVHCILPGVRGHSGVNSRQVLERFWGLLLQSLGARLATFETHLQTS